MESELRENRELGYEIWELKWFPSKKSSTRLPDLGHILLTLFKKLLNHITKLVELNPSEDYVINFEFIVVVEWLLSR